ncbi:CotH kinase family protein [Balneolales bacterium ANBcel1]|nr:CotH kinase family protein [Balneolales bacterium ANBcel1]
MRAFVFALLLALAVVSPTRLLALPGANPSHGNGSNTVVPPSTMQALPHVVINEVQASNNTTIADEDGDFEDWIELYNAGSEPVNLVSFGLSDREGDHYRWVLPDTLLNPGEFLLIWASGKDRRTPGRPLHTNFSIASEGEPLRLTDMNGNKADTLPPVALPSDYSYGRFPDGSNQWQLFAYPTPGEPNSEEGFGGLTPAPEFSNPPGFYNTEFLLMLESQHPHDRIHYTTDGSRPTVDSPVYREPIRIDHRSGEKDRFTGIQTSPHPSWSPPATPVFKGQVIRAIAVREGYRESEVVTGTWFVDPMGRDRYSFPVISIATDSVHLFSDETGILVPGNRFDPDFIYSGNYYERGREWEREAHLEFYDTAKPLFSDGIPRNSEHQAASAGQPMSDRNQSHYKPDDNHSGIIPPIYEEQDGFRQNIGLRIHGGGTRRYPQKSLRIYARSDYDWYPEINYPAIPGNQREDRTAPLDTYKRLILRSSGDDWHHTMFKDAMIQSLYSDRKVDQQSFRPSVVFINGEYWGIHNIRERYDDWYIETNYGIPRDKVAILVRNADVNTGEPSDNRHYVQMRDFAVMEDLAIEENYAYMKTQMDIDNFLKYVTLNVYAANADWPHNNIRFWRKRTDTFDPDALPGADGRWRWMIFDMDASFGYPYAGNASWWAQYDMNMVEWITGIGNPRNEGRWVNALFNSLIENESFRHRFITLLADDLNTRFRPEFVKERIREFRDLYEPEMEEHLNRHPGSAGESLSGWHDHIQVMKTFAEKRPGYLRKHLSEYFDLPGTANLSIRVEDTDWGYMQVNGMDIHPKTPGIDEALTEWTGTYFKGVPVTVTPMPDNGFEFDDWLDENSHLLERDDIEIHNDSITGLPVVIWTPGSDNLALSAVNGWETSARPGGEDIPTRHSLAQNYPNPFNNRTVIPYELAEQARVLVVVFTVTGRVVRSFETGVQQPGTHHLHFSGEGLASGLYLYRMRILPVSGSEMVLPAKKMMLIR